MDFSWAEKLYAITSSKPEVILPIVSLVMLALLLTKRPATALYVAMIPFVNWSFAHVPTVPMPDGGEFQPLAIVTGLILVVRDFAQREISHRIFFMMALGLLFSSLTTPAAIVLASGVAFLISELVDWAVFTFTKRPLSKRVLWSCLASAPLDSAIFLYGANMVTPGVFAWSTIITSIVSKLVGALIVARVVGARERRAAAAGAPANAALDTMKQPQSS